MTQEEINKAYQKNVLRVYEIKFKIIDHFFKYVAWVSLSGATLYIAYKNNNNIILASLGLMFFSMTLYAAVDIPKLVAAYMFNFGEQSFSRSFKIWITELILLAVFLAIFWAISQSLNGIAFLKG